MALFSTKTHGVLDYVTVGTLLVLPRALGWSERMTSIVTGAAVNTLAYSLATRYELGLFKVLPMRGHLALDALSGAVFLGAPFLFPDEDPSVTSILAAIGMFELLAAATTESEPSYGEQADQLAESVQQGAHNLRERTLGS